MIENPQGDSHNRRNRLSFSPRVMIRIIAACAGCLFLIWIASCGMSHWKDWYSVAHPPRVEIGNRRIVFYGTPEYDAVVIDLKYTATQARDKSIQWQKRNSGSIPGRHRMIVNDEYVFSDLCKSGVSLSGYYVDGNTGKVRRVFDDFIPTGQAEELGYTGTSAVFSDERKPPRTKAE